MQTPLNRRVTYNLFLRILKDKLKPYRTKTRRRRINLHHRRGLPRRHLRGNALRAECL
jgi:hypothetical protein